jgi:outer membrane autotransporter protein
MIGKNLYGCPENHYLRLRPSAGLRYYHLEQDGYTDNAGIKYDSVNGDILTGVLGVELTDNMMVGDYPANQKFHVNATYDLVNDDVNSYMLLPNGSGYNIGVQAEDEFGIEAGYGLEVELTDNLSAGVNYELDWRKNYTAHTGTLNLKYSF